MKVLVIGNSESVYVRDFVQNMQLKTGYTFDVLSWNEGRLTPNENVREISVSLPRLLKNVRKVRGVWKLWKYINALKKLDRYDVCHFHYVGKEAVLVSKIAREKSNHMISSVWGSDFHRSSDKFRNKQMRVYDSSEIITFATEEARNAFVDYYPMYSVKTRICTFGLSPLDFLRNGMGSQENCREVLGIPKDAITICVGYNAGRWQRHKEVIRSIVKVKNKLLRQTHHKLCLILPMTYGRDEKYVREVEEELFGCGIQRVVLHKFMNPLTSAALKTVTDIFINVQPTDVLSGSMLEHLYAGSVVVTGSWLPYKVLEDMKIHLHRVDKVDEVGSKIYSILPYLGLWKALNEDKKESIYRLASWEHNIDSWEAIYREVADDV